MGLWNHPTSPLNRFAKRPSYIQKIDYVALGASSSLNGPGSGLRRLRSPMQRIPERALILFKVWCSKLSRQIYGPRWHKREPYGVTFVVAIEYHKSGQIHLHALIFGVGETRRLTWMDHWHALDELAGFARIVAVGNNEAVSNYVTKYVTKGGEVDLSGNLRIRSRDLFDAAPSPESET